MAAFRRCVFAGIASFLVCLVSFAAYAVDAVPVPLNARAIDLALNTQLQANIGHQITVSTAADNDAIIRKMEVHARNEDAQHWLVFALTNPTNEQIDRLFVVPNYRLSGSSFIWPDLDMSRVETISSSEGFAPVRIASDTADVFEITLNPGATVTYVAELKTDKLPQIVLWEPEAYKDSLNAYTLYQGIVIGIAGLLAIFLSILFVVKGTLMFPATAVLAWTVLAYLCIDFGFWNKVIRLDGPTNASYRVIVELCLVGALIVFLYGYLALNRWHRRYNHVTLVSIILVAGLIVFAIIDPPFTAAIARISLSLVAIFGLGLIIYLALFGFDRAILLLPTWLLFMAWVFGAFMAISGSLVNDMVQPALNGGLVLIVLLIAFTILQHAFAGGSLAQGMITDTERSALAIVGSGDITWDWDAERDQLTLSQAAEEQLGLGPQNLTSSLIESVELLHNNDRDRFRATLDMIAHHRRGRISDNFRFRTADGIYKWFQLRARPIVGSDGEVIRCVGTLLDITDKKVTEERLLQNAVNDNMTGLPNRELFVDRLTSAITRARFDDASPPVVIVIDLDKFNTINENLGISIGDSVLLTAARRIGRLLKPQDTLARIGGDEFGLIIASESDASQIERFAETLLRGLRAPINFQGREITLYASIGITISSNNDKSASDLMTEAEIALYNSKQKGNQVTLFQSALRHHHADVLTLETDLKSAIQRQEFEIVYQPIIRLDTREVAGFESLLRWQHPVHGQIMPAEFIPIAERTGDINAIGYYVLDQAAQQLATWQASLRMVHDPIFMSVNLSSRQLLRREIVSDVRATLNRCVIQPGTLKLELTESLVMENPELAEQILDRLRDLGVSLSLDDFGTGYSSLGYLNRFHFDTIKIDKSFVQSNNSTQRSIILKTIITLAHDLGMDVVAEGAENETEALELRQLECEYAQGFHFGRPMKANEAFQLLQFDHSAKPTTNDQD